MSLFRKEALDNTKLKFQGNILVTNPLSITLLTILSCSVTALCVAFIIFGGYTQKQRVIGVLVPDKGLIRVQASQAGIVIKLHVKEGDHVQKGQALYVLNSERTVYEGVVAQTEIRSGLLSREESYIKERMRLEKIHQSESEKNKKQVLIFLEEEKQLAQQKKIVQKQIELYKKNLSRYKEMATQGFVSTLELDKSRQELFSHEVSYLRITREKTAISHDIEILQNKIKTSELILANNLSSSERNRLATKKSILENDIQREVIITAPVSGTIAAIMAKLGQQVDTGSLLSILPEGSELLAELYAPSKAISFIKTGSSVRLRYTAFPYQKFGQHKGEVINVSRVAVPAHEIKNLDLSKQNTLFQIYRIKVKLPSQSIKAYGLPQALQAGMDIEADVLLDRRRLYEWLFEPIYGIYGRA